jgi:thioredoxin reductase (NADPH)
MSAPAANEPRDLVIVGAGPAGLATAIAAAQAGLDAEVVEKGCLVNSIFNFPRQMVFFTTAELLEIGGLPFVTPYEKPTQGEALRYYRRVAEAYGLRISFDEEVLAVAREKDGFRLRTRHARAGEGERRARSVVLALGYYDHPNLLGVPGEALPHVAHYWTEAHPFWRKRVVVVGGKNSAAIAALELYRAGAEVTLVHRGARLGDSIKYWIKPDIENRIKEGAITARFGALVEAITPETVRLREAFGGSEIPAQAVFLLTGYHPDAGLLRDAGVRVDEATLRPDHDPQTLETNVPGLYVAGSIAAGRETGKIFIETGRFHGERIVAHLRESSTRTGSRRAGRAPRPRA